MHQKVRSEPEPEPRHVSFRSDRSKHLDFDLMWDQPPAADRWALSAVTLSTVPTCVWHEPSSLKHASMSRCVHWKGKSWMLLETSWMLLSYLSALVWLVLVFILQDICLGLPQIVSVTWEWDNWSPMETVKLSHFPVGWTKRFWMTQGA